MADFRQNNVSLDTRNSTFNYTPPVSNIGGIGQGIATGFSAYIEGVQKTEDRQYRQRNAELAELANQRAQRSEDREQYQFDLGLKQRQVQNLALTQSFEVAGNTVEGLLRAYGTNMDGFPIPVSQRSPEQQRILADAVQQVSHMTGILSGQGRGSQILNTRMVALYRDLNRATNGDMAIELNEIFKSFTGKSYNEVATNVMEVTQNEEISAATQRRELIGQWRQTFGLSPDKVSDTAVMDFVQNFLTHKRTLEEASTRATIEGQRLTNFDRRLDIENKLNAQRALAAFGGLANSLSGSLYSTINNLRAKGQATPENISGLLASSRNQVTALTAQLAQAGVPTSTINTIIGALDKELAVAQQYATGAVDSSVATNRLKAFEAITNYEYNSQVLPGTNLTVLEATLQSDWISSLARIPGNLEGVAAGATVGTQLTPRATQLFLGALAGNPNETPYGRGRGTPGAAGKADVDANSAFLTALVRGPERGNATILGDPNLGSDLSPGRSLGLVPGFLRPNVNATPNMNARITALNNTLTTLSQRADTTHVAYIEPVIRLAADPASAGTFYIDPKMLPEVQSLIKTYFRRATEAMNQDFQGMRTDAYREMRGAAAAGGITPEMLVPADVGQYRLGAGIEMYETGNGMVQFRPSSYVTGADRVSAANTARFFNTKYAPKLNTVVRAYAHLYQGNNDYRTAFSTLLVGGSTIAADNEGILDAAESQLLGEFPGLTRSDARSLLEGTIKLGQ